MWNPMKQVHEPHEPTKDDSKDGKANHGYLRFVDLFRRVAAENQQEKMTNG